MWHRSGHRCGHDDLLTPSKDVQGSEGELRADSVLAAPVPELGRLIEYREWCVWCCGISVGTRRSGRCLEFRWAFGVQFVLGVSVGACSLGRCLEFRSVLGVLVGSWSFRQGLEPGVLPLFTVRCSALSARQY